MKISTRNSNAFAGILLIILLAVLFISVWVMMKPYAIIYEKFTTDKTVMADGRAMSLISNSRDMWFTAITIFAITLCIWYLVSATKKDPQSYFRI